jgi:hypothetical protein
MRQSRFLDYSRHPWTDTLDVIARLIHEGELRPASGRYGPATITCMGESWTVHRVAPDDACQRIVTDMLTLESMDIGSWRREFVYHHLGGCNA